MAGPGNVSVVRGVPGQRRVVGVVRVRHTTTVAPGSHR